MRRLLTAGGAVVVLLAIIVAVFIARSGTSAGSVTLDALGTAPRVGEDAGFSVRFTNGSGQAVTNPQYHTVVRVGEDDWTCQGYRDPASGDDVMGNDPETHPLTIPAREAVQVTIYCRIPDDVSLDSAQVLLRP